MVNTPQSSDSGPKGFAGLDAFVSDLSPDIGAPTSEDIPISPKARPQASSAATHAGRLFSGRWVLIGAIGVLVVLALVIANNADKHVSPASLPTPPVSVSSPAPSGSPTKQPVRFQFDGAFVPDKALQALYDNYDASHSQSVWQMNAPTAQGEFREWTGQGRVSALQTEFFKEGNDERALFVTQTVPDNNDTYECHACPVLLGAAVFYRSGNTWRILIRQDYLAVAGAWGKFHPGDRVRVGPSVIGILFHDESTGQGQRVGSALLIAPVDGTIRNLAVIDSTADNEGNCGQAAGPCFKYTSRVAFVPGQNPKFYDLTVNYSGTDLKDDNVRDISRTDVYAYVKGQYQKQTTRASTQPDSTAAGGSSPVPAESGSEGTDKVRSMIAAAIGDDKARVIALKEQLEATPRPDRGDRARCRALNKLGLDLLQRANYPNAITVFDSAVSADPSDIEARENLGYANLLADRLPQAEKVLISTLSIAPARASGWANLGRVYALRGDEQGAVGAFLNTIRFSGNREKTFDFLANLRDNDPSEKVRSAAGTAIASSPREVSNADIVAPLVSPVPSAKSPPQRQ